MIRERIGIASLIVFILALFTQPILVRFLFIPDGIAFIMSGALFIVSIILACFGKGIVRIMMFVLLGITIIPFLTIAIIFGMGLDI